MKRNYIRFIHCIIYTLCIAILTISLSSCDEIARKLGYEKINSENAHNQSSPKQSQPANNSNYESPYVTRSFTVNARVYHFVGTAYDVIEKATNRYENRNIQVYSNGAIYSDGFPVRFSLTQGYDYECNRGNIINKFNSTEIDNIL